MPNCVCGEELYSFPWQYKRGLGGSSDRPFPVLLSLTGEGNPSGAGETVLCTHGQCCLSQGLQHPPRGTRSLGESRGECARGAMALAG